MAGNYKEKIVDSITGEETWRDYTAEEIAEVELAQAEAAEEAAKLNEAAGAKAAAEAKLEALGLTSDDLKALGL
jgi:hypothetical protein